MNPSETKNDVLLTGAEVARWLNLPLSTIYEHARQNLLPCVRIGRRVRFKRSDLEAFIAAGGKPLAGAWTREVPR